MAEPVRFREANTLWEGWPADDRRQEVGDLPAYTDGNLTISCWRMGFRERLRALFTGRIWLHLHGRQPPVYLSGDLPFLRSRLMKEPGRLSFKAERIAISRLIKRTLRMRDGV